MIFKIENEDDKYPDADKLPKVTLIDERIWKDQVDQNQVDWSGKSLEFLEPSKPGEPLGKAGSKFKKSLLEEASSMAIVPLFVQLDEELLPETPLNSNGDSKVDYDDDSFTNEIEANFAAKPYRGGKWFYHIVIVHKSKARVLPGSPPMMSVLRIMEDGQLVHLLTQVNRRRGQFKNLDLKKDVLDMAPITIGRQSYLITSSIGPESDLLDQDEYSVVEAFKLEDKEAAVTAVTGRIGYIEYTKISEPVQTSHATGVVKIDFYTHVHVAILDRDPESSRSRIRVFQFNPESLAPSQVLSLAYELLLDADSIPYTAIHSFERKGVKYLTVSRPKKAIIFKVTANGSLEKISELNDDALTELIPVASGRTLEDVSLVEFDISSSDVTGKRLHPFTYPWSLKQSDSVSEPLGSLSSGTGTFALQALARGEGILGVHLGLRNNNAEKDLGFQIFLFPEIPKYYLDRRLQKEAELYPGLYSIPQVDPTIEADIAMVITELDKYVAKSGSVVSGKWDVKEVKTAKMTAPDLPENTVVKLHLRDNATDLTSEETIDFRPMLNLDLAEVESKLTQVNDNFAFLDGLTDDLLLKDSSAVQTVNTPIVFEEDLTVSGDLTLDKTDGSKFKIGTLKSHDEKHSVALEQLDNIYSATQNNIEIGGTTIFKDSVTFNGVKASTLMTLGDTSSLINPDNALRYSGGQTISIPQTFDGPVKVAGDLALDIGIGLSKGGLKLTKADIPSDNTPVNRNVKFDDKVTVEEPGITAPSFSDLPKSLVDNIDHVAPKASQNVHIKGKLRIVPDEADVDSFSATGSRFGLVKPDVNTFDISDMYDHAAWLSAPPSKKEITDSSEISFTSKFDVNELQMVQMPPNDLKINNILLSDFVRRKSGSGVTYNIGGDKTFVNITIAEEIMAKTFNDKTLDQFVNKMDEQNIASSAQFNAGLEAIHIEGFDGSIPTVDGKDLTQYFHENVAVLLALEKDKHFNTITIGAGATLKIKDMINDYNLKERVDQIVKTDDAVAEISGDKVVLSPASLGPVQVGQINTAYSEADNTYGKSYVVTDFVNIKNPQSMPAGKTFSGAVKLGDVSFLGSESDIVTENGNLRAPPLTNCFIDVNSDDKQEVNRKVSFEELTTNKLNIAKGNNICTSSFKSLIEFFRVQVLRSAMLTIHWRMLSSGLARLAALIQKIARN